MSSPLLPIPGPLGRATPPSATGAGDACAFVTELDAGTRALEIGAARGGPPPEVLGQMLAAGRLYDKLRESGHEVCFSTPAPGERLAIELRDARGGVRTLSAGEAIVIASGKPAG
jgi:hypothetical protein